MEGFNIKILKDLEIAVVPEVGYIFFAAKHNDMYDSGSKTETENTQKVHKVREKVGFKRDPTLETHGSLAPNKTMAAKQH